MKKSFISILALCCAVSAVSVSCREKNIPLTDRKEESPEITISAPAENRIPFSVKNISAARKYLKADIRYPQFKGFPELNKIIRETITVPYKTFAKTAKNNWKETDNARRETGSSDDTPPLEYDVICDPVISNDRYITLLITTYVFEGGAHGDTSLSSVTWDIGKKRTVSITEASGCTLDEIAEACRTYLLDNLQYGGDDQESKDSRVKWITDGTAADKDTYSVFTCDGITTAVYFAPYQVAPHSSGVVQVPLAVR